MSVLRELSRTLISVNDIHVNNFQGLTYFKHQYHMLKIWKEGVYRPTAIYLYKSCGGYLIYDYYTRIHVL